MSAAHAVKTTFAVSTSTAVTSSLSPSTLGQPVTFTAVVTPTGATGTVTFLDGSTPLATQTLSGGTATFTTSTLSAGSHSISASYGGATGFAPSTSSKLTQVVRKLATTTSLTSSANPSTVGQPVTFTATVAPSAATGSVTFFDGTTALGAQTLSGGTASFTTSSLAAGTHTITATYTGDASYASSTSAALAQVVSKH
jgi:hypothetical protein